MNRFAKRYPKTAKVISGAGKALTIAGKAYALASTVASIVNSEKKYYDAVISASPQAGTPTITHISDIAQGDTDSQRNGDSVAVKSLQLEGYVQFNSASATATCRVFVIRDNENENGTAPTVLQYLGSATPTIIALRNMDFSQRFTTLYDKTFVADTAQVNRPFSAFKKFKNMKDKRGLPIKQHHITWVSGTTEARGHIYVITISNTVTNHPTVNLNTRLRYYDN